MHEMSIAGAIVDSAVRHARGRSIEAVGVRVGRLRQVVPASLAFGFELLSKGTACDGARLAIEVVPARVRCSGCSTEWELEVPIFRCAACGSAVAVLEGEELLVDWIEVSESGREEPCTA